MLRSIILDNKSITAQACKVLKEENKVIPIVAVNLKGSKSLDIKKDWLGSYSIAIYNEYGFGFSVSKEDIESILENRDISFHEYLMELEEILIHEVITKIGKSIE